MNSFVDAFKFATYARSMGIKTLLELEDKKLKKCLEFAYKENIQYVVIIGEDEVKSRKVLLKDMINGNNVELDLDNPSNLNNLVKQCQQLDRLLEFRINILFTKVVRRDLG